MAFDERDYYVRARNRYKINVNEGYAMISKMSELMFGAYTPQKIFLHRSLQFSL